MRKRNAALLMIPVLLALGMLVAGTARAQCDIDAELERATARIERAGEVVERSGLPEARELLHAAVTRRDEAKGRWGQGERDLACRLARVSQSLAAKSAEVAMRGIRGLEELEHMLQKTNELIRETRPLLGESGSDEARRILSAAEERQKEAWNAFRSRRPRMAVKLTLMARDGAERARRVVEGGAATDSRSLGRELKRTDRLLEEAVRVLGEDGENDGEGMLAAARRLQTQAKRQARRGHPQLALALTRQSRVMIRRALGEADVQPAADDVRTMISTTQALVDRLGPAVEESGNQRARQLLERSEKLLNSAREALQAGRLGQALGSARSASALALDVSDMLERGGEE